jgi:hypothetical protein
VPERLILFFESVDPSLTQSGEHPIGHVGCSYADWQMTFPLLIKPHPPAPLQIVGGKH